MIDLHFAEQITTGVTNRLKRLGAWFEEYATDGLIGQELSPGPMNLGRSTQPTICMVEDIDSIEVLDATDLGDGVVEARCSVMLAMELDLNNEDWDSASRLATVQLTLEIHTPTRKVTGHRLHDAYTSED